jgi:hypothetical protein
MPELTILLSTRHLPTLLIFRRALGSPVLGVENGVRQILRVLKPTNTAPTTNTTNSSPYDRNFQQKLIDGDDYPHGYEDPDCRLPARLKNWVNQSIKDWHNLDLLFRRHGSRRKSIKNSYERMCIPVKKIK